MTHKPLLTEADLWRDGRPFRLRDLEALTGWCRRTILAHVERGTLHGYQGVSQRGSPWQFDRADVRAWWFNLKQKAS